MLARRFQANVHLALTAAGSFLRSAAALLGHVCCSKRAGAGGARRQHAVLDHQGRQDAFAQTAVGNAQPLARPHAQDGLEDRAAGEHEVGAVAADARLGDALLVGAPQQVAVTARTSPRRASSRRRGCGHSACRPSWMPATVVTVPEVPSRCMRRPARRSAT